MTDGDDVRDPRAAPTGGDEPDTRLHDALAAALPGILVQTAGYCRGLGLPRGATHDAATAVHVINRTRLSE